MTDAELKAEIVNDPVGIGYAGLEGGPCATKINARMRTGNRPTTYGASRRWGTENGVLIRAQRRVNDVTETDELMCSICRSFLDADPERVLDTNDAIIIGMVDHLHSSGFFGTTYGASDATNDTRRTELLTLGGSDISRAEELWGIGTRVGHSQITEVMR